MAKIRIYSPFFPYPHTEAAFQVIFNQIVDCRTLGHQVEVVTWKDDPGTLSQKRKLCEHAWPIDVQVISFHTADSGARLNRAGRVLASFIGPHASPELFYYPPRADRRVELAPVDLEIYHYSFAHCWLSQRPSSATKTVVHMHNLEHRLFQLRAQEESGLAPAFLRRTSKRLLSHERELKILTSEIWQVSPADKTAFQKLFGESPQRIVSPSIDPNSVMHRWDSQLDTGSKVYKLGFIGGLNFGPNKESFRWILRHLAPLLQEYGAGKFEILQVGKSDDEIEKQAAHFPFVRFLGFLPDTESWWRQLSYTMIPDLTGAGIRVKLLESLASKVPVLTNTLAAGRIPEDLQKEPGLFSSDSADDWLKQIASTEPFEARAKLRHFEYPRGLRGDQIYQFLNAGYFT